MLHFKDRQPEETIKILKSFFNSKNLTLKEVQFIQNESNTFSCHYKLYFKNYCILSANGKGITKEYTLASCLAEMYERFCAAQEDMCGNIISYLKYQELNYKKHNYYIDPNEQLVDNLKEDIYFQKTLINLFTENDKELIDKVFQNHLYKIPYQSYDDNEQIFYTPFYLQLGEGTNGLAAGNTLEEALVQGISEIFERYGIELFFRQPKFKYFYLNIKTLPQYLQEIVNNIEKQNQKVFLFDLSYNYKIPVILALIYNSNLHSYSLNFGASPILEIAVERSLTEIYQGKKKLSANNIINSYLTDWIETTYALNFSNEMLNQYPILENLILFSKEKEYNNQIFLNEANNNKELLLHLINIGNQLNIKFYYKNLSYLDNFYALRIVTNQKLNLYLITKYEDKFSNIPYKNKLFNLYIDYMQHVINQNITYNYLSMLKEEKHINYNFFIFLLSLPFCDIFNPMMIQLRDISQTYSTIQNLLYKADYSIPPYNLVNNYMIDNTYLPEEIQKILKIFGYENIEIKYYSNKNIINILLKQLKDLYNSQDYENFIQLFIK